MLIIFLLSVFSFINSETFGDCNDFTIGNCNSEDGLILEDDLVNK